MREVEEREEWGRWESTNDITSGGRWSRCGATSSEVVDRGGERGRRGAEGRRR